jgi:hypothetical protein
MSITSTGLVGWGSGKVGVCILDGPDQRRTGTAMARHHLAYPGVVRARGRRRASEQDLELPAELSPLVRKPPTLVRRRPAPATSGSNARRRRGLVRRACKSRSDLFVNYVYS